MCDCELEQRLIDMYRATLTRSAAADPGSATRFIELEFARRLEDVLGYTPMREVTADVSEGQMSYLE